MPQKRNTKRLRPANVDLAFIKDAQLQENIKSAIEMLSILHLLEQKKGSSLFFSKEVRRMMILYAASMMEALLLYLYKKEGRFSLKATIYTHSYTLPMVYQNGETVAVLVQKKEVEKPEHELMLHILKKYFVSKKIIGPDLASRISKASTVRNTFHLSKSRKGILCSSQIVRDSERAVVDIITIVRDHILN